ncbi:DUF2652 domain-containing protein [Fontibacter flavus]|uniref:DUF2652 domain-containing protein n=1 Tax=Fontibacter flavus TaxID=654838 RepID=A0ABV6FWV0_9BACT
MNSFYEIPQIKKGILFIPDISGFTQFVTSTEVSHSQHIISELLELIISEVGNLFTVSEIEGDAVLFYRFQNDFDIEEIIKLCEKVFLSFHSYLKTYRRDLVCHCGACTMTHKLGLKFIIHIGDFGLNQVGKREKLYGKEVILAHRLMKNPLDLKEYVLVSSSYDLFDIKLLTSADLVLEEFGYVSFGYMDLTPLKDRIPEPLPIQRNFYPEVKKFVYTVIPAISFQDIVLAITEPEHRKAWMKGVSNIELKGHKINRIKSNHDCVINGNTIQVTLEDLIREENEVKILEHAYMQSMKTEIIQLFTIRKTEKDEVILGMGTVIIGSKNPFVRMFKSLIERVMAVQNSKNITSLGKYLKVLKY